MKGQLFKNVPNRKKYNAILERVEILLQSPDNIENKGGKNYIEFII
jgi:hypothetical protein